MSSPARNSGESGALGERGSPAEIDAPGSRAQRLVGKANTCSLSFDSIVNWMERYREVVRY
jgi:hypothetical protein